MTAAELIAQLDALPPDKPIRVALVDETAEGEFTGMAYPIFRVDARNAAIVVITPDDPQPAGALCPNNCACEFC